MTFSIKIPGASFTNYVAEGIPAYDSLSLFELFGTDPTSSVRNYAGTKAASTVVGTPTYGTGYANVTNITNGFEGAAAASNGYFTYMIVTTINTAVGGGGYCGRWGGGGNQDMLWQNGANLLVNVDGANKLTTPWNPGGTGFWFLAATFDGSTVAVQTGSGGVLTKVTAAYSAAGTFTSSKFRVGALYGGGTTKVAAVARAATALADSDVLSMYGYLTRFLSTRNITVN